ncbi:MAG: glycosyltransferase [Terriglobales bacterium]
MKIVHALGWYYPESFGGTEVYVAGLAQRLRRAGHHVAIAAPLRGLNGAQTYEHDSLPVFRYPGPANPTRAECQVRVATRGSEEFIRWLASERPDVLHVHTFTVGLGVFELEAARNLGIRIIVTNHLGSIGYTCLRGTLMRWGQTSCDGICAPFRCSACVLQARGLPKLASFAVTGFSVLLPRVFTLLPGRLGTALGLPETIRHHQRLQRRVLDAANRFIVLNRAAFDILVANGAPTHKLEINYLGTSFEISRKPTADQRPTSRPVRFGYFGRFVEIKGVFDLARAVQSLPKDIEFLLEFRGPCNGPGERAILRQLREMLAGDSRVSFCDPVPSAEAPQILKSYDILLVPSRWFENGPTVMNEAFAVGTPVVGTRIGAMPEIVQDGVNGRLFEPGQWPQLAAIMKEIALDPTGTIDRWRRALPPTRTMDDIAADYECTYLAVMNSAQNLQERLVSIASEATPQR